MKTFHLSQTKTPDVTKIDPNVTAVGFFDGVHKGHQQVIETAQQKAEDIGLKWAVMTFDPHPSVVLKKGRKHARYITPLYEKAEILRQMGIDYLFVVNFDQALASLAPQQFVDDYFVRLKVKHVVAGFDFSYGHKGEGSMKTLPIHAKGRFSRTVVAKVEKDEEKVSSTRIRKLLDEGVIGEANQLLGRPYSVHGTVVSGDQRGRTIGYPTANIQMDSRYHLPKQGVYAVTVHHNEKNYYGMANLGVKPTFEDKSALLGLEVHLFDFNEDLYGKFLTISFHGLVRDERKFNGVKEVKEQVMKDEEHIRSFFRIE